ncbi:hypothetical protein JTB14_001057 [Gonioctena quinquepunctata]|nr:hypothetical protein JTB14_001057 [Gonioctena quinquepunctata]
MSKTLKIHYEVYYRSKHVQLCGFCDYLNISDIDPEGIPLTPTIVEVGVKPMVIYYVYFEKDTVGNDGEATFLDALKVAYALYFILNIKYPKDLSTTMEFLQRMFLKIHLDSGSKSKKASAVRMKFFNFINKLVTIFGNKKYGEHGKLLTCLELSDIEGCDNEDDDSENENGNADGIREENVEEQSKINAENFNEEDIEDDLEIQSDFESN